MQMKLKVLTNFALLASFAFAPSWVPLNLIQVCSAQNVRQTSERCNSLHKCAEVGDVKILSDLLRQTTQIEARDEFGETPLFRAVRYNKNEAAALLISHGANVNFRDSNGTTPLMMAVLSQNLTLINILLNAGADANAADDKGRTVLMHGAVFVLKQTCPILRLLVSHGANVNAAADDGWTALIYSIRCYSFQAVKCLLSLGANASVRDRKGLSALEHADAIGEAPPANASRKIQRRMRKILIAAGAN